MSKTEILESFYKLKNYIEGEEYKGYDPYDFLNSRFPFTKLGSTAAFLLTQIHKRNPINIRPILGIPKDYVPKGMGLFLKSYAFLYRINPTDDIKRKMQFIFDWLVENASNGYSGYCWGLNYTYSSRLSFLKANIPSVVVTAFVHDGIYEYYQVTRDEEALPILNSACEFVLKDLPQSRNDFGICFSYTPIKKDICFNANALGSQILARTYSLTGDEKILEIAKSSIDFTVNYMKEDGRWNYRIFPNGCEKQQIDFHQGYILESIRDYIRFSGDESPIYKQALKKGTKYYFENQFMPNGKSLWRVPLEWPIDIHNQAQGIITFSNSVGLDEKYLRFAEKIAVYAIENMQSEKGYFYYRLGRFYKNKISYIRWGQAWMFLALITFIRSKKTYLED